LPPTCTCANGTPATGESCTSDGETCISCNQGFKWLDGTCKSQDV
jgi:hypothetical protein